MNRRVVRRVLLASALAVSSLGITAQAWAGGCTFALNPSQQSWRGATVGGSGSGFGPGNWFFNFTSDVDGTQIQREGTTNDNGTVVFSFTIPANFPVGSVNYFIQDQLAACSINGNYTVNASPPTTTTSPPPPTTTTTTTTTTTLAVTTTTAAATTTTASATTTTDVEDTTTTSNGETGTGGVPSWTIWVIAVLVVALVAALLLGQRRRAGGTNPPPPSG